MRLFITVAFFIVLSIFCTLSDIAANEGCDASTVSTSGLSMSEKMRPFLVNVALDLKKDWFKNEVKSLIPIQVLAIYSSDSNSWHFYQKQSHEDNSALNLAALQLVKTKLSTTKPPTNESFGIQFLFCRHLIGPLLKVAKTPSNTVPADVDFGPFMTALQHKIKSIWILEEKSSGHLKAVVIFKLKKDGSIDKLALDRSSGVKEFDEAALRSVRKSAPFLPPPGSEDVDIAYTFDNEAKPKPIATSTEKFFTVIVEDYPSITAHEADLQNEIAKFKS